MPTLNIFDGTAWSQMGGSIDAMKDVYGVEMVHWRTQIGVAGNHVEIEVEGYQSESDHLIVFQNSVLIVKDQDYDMDIEGRGIVNPDGNWDQNTQFDFFIFKGVVGSANVKAYYSDYEIIDAPTDTVPIGIPEYNFTSDILQVYKNSTYMHLGRDYKITTDSKEIVSETGDWPIDTLFDFVVNKQVRLSQQAGVGFPGTHMILNDDVDGTPYRIGISNGNLYAVPHYDEDITAPDPDPQEPPS